MSYRYSFDTRQVGTTWFWRDTFEFLIKGLTRLRDLLEAWNKSEDVPPYVDLPEALVARTAASPEYQRGGGDSRWP